MEALNRSAHLLVEQVGHHADAIRRDFTLHLLKLAFGVFQVEGQGALLFTEHTFGIVSHLIRLLAICSGLLSVLGAKVWSHVTLRLKERIEAIMAEDVTPVVSVGARSDRFGCVV